MGNGLPAINTEIQANKISARKVAIRFAATLFLVPALAACTSTSQTISHGYQVSADTLDLVPVGSSREQVLLALGSPSTTFTEGSEIFYYISQTKKRPVAFARAKVVDQKILAVYFNDDQTVSKLANYGLKDGKVFDFISRTTPTGGREISFLGQILGAAGSGPINPFGS